jgi:hypothetical protein
MPRSFYAPHTNHDRGDRATEVPDRLSECYVFEYCGGIDTDDTRRRRQLSQEQAQASLGKRFLSLLAETQQFPVQVSLEFEQQYRSNDYGINQEIGTYILHLGWS